MSLNNILTGSYVLAFATPGETGAIVATTVLSQSAKVMVDGQGFCYGGPISISVTGWTNGIIIGGSGSTNLSPLESHVRAEGNLVYRQYDYVMVPISGGQMSNPVPPPATIPQVPLIVYSKVWIVNATQTSVKGE